LTFGPVVRPVPTENALSLGAFVKGGCRFIRIIDVENPVADFMTLRKPVKSADLIEAVGEKLVQGNDLAFGIEGGEGRFVFNEVVLPPEITEHFADERNLYWGRDLLPSLSSITAEHARGPLLHIVSTEIVWHY
jgi:hypothetical protein